MTSIIGRYLSQLFLARLLLIVFGLAAMAILLDLLANSDDLIKPGSDIAEVLFRYALLRLPGIVSQITPISVLVAALITFVGLARHSELTAIIVSGVSPFRQVRALLPAVFLVAVGQFVIEDQAVPDATSALRDWGVGDYGDFATADQNDMVWFRQGGNYVRARPASANEHVIHDMTIFHRDTTGRLVERIEAESATYKDGDWILEKVTRTGAEDPTTTKLDQLAWPEAIEIPILHTLTLHPKELSWIQVLSLADEQGYGNRPRYLYRLWLHKKIARPVATVLMILLAVAAVQRILPRRHAGLMIAAGIGAGFLFWIGDELIITIGETGLLPAVVAAWAAPIILALLSSTVILRDDGS